VNIVPAVEPGRQEVLALENLIREKLGAGVEFHVVLVRQLETGPGGKFWICRSLLTEREGSAEGMQKLPAAPAQAGP
jgi:hypothetical protein